MTEQNISHNTGEHSCKTTLKAVKDNKQIFDFAKYRFHVVVQL